jgi:hypothetical protein
MDKQHVNKRMSDMMVLIDKSIELTDDRNEMLMLACAMLQRTTEIFESTLGVEGRKQMFKDLV